MAKTRAPRNKTLTVSESEREVFRSQVLHLDQQASLEAILNKTIQADLFKVAGLLPDSFVDLLFIDPPYNLQKTFNTFKFKRMELDQYSIWVNSWLSKLLHTLKPNATVYICADWRSSMSIPSAVGDRLCVRNRITWEREKGRGAQSNWKNNTEDIWFFTVSDDYTYNVDQVKLKRKVLAPYTKDNGEPKDWDETDQGRYRLTYPSNIWTDITVPFWSMPENTDHPTQKPEKLLAKLILASSNKNDIILDPFLGSGTTSVVAKKLDRRYVGIEIDELYACLAEKRLRLADRDRSIQGYSGGFFWERNSLSDQKITHQNTVDAETLNLF